MTIHSIFLAERLVLVISKGDKAPRLSPLTEIMILRSANELIETGRNRVMSLR